MRWGPFLQIAVLAAASLAAPQAFNPAGLDSKAVSGMLGGRIEDIPLDKLAALSDLASAREGGATPTQADVGAAILKALKEPQSSMKDRLRGEVLRIAESLRKGYLKYREKVLAVMIIIGLVTVAVLFLGAVPVIRVLAKFYLTFLFGLACHWLMWMALAMFAFYAASRLNPWPLIPREFFYAPAGYLLLSGMFIRLLDQNYPLWNTLLKGLGATLLSTAGIAGYGLFR